MAVIVPGEEKRTAFYDPYYRPGAMGSLSNESESNWFDEFSVFNHLHLPKPKGLSLTPPQVLRNASSLRSSRQTEMIGQHNPSNTSTSTLEAISRHCNDEQKLSCLEAPAEKQNQKP